MLPHGKPQVELCAVCAKRCRKRGTGRFMAPTEGQRYVLLVLLLLALVVVGSIRLLEREEVTPI